MKYVALLRGIGPGNPNMRNEKLRATIEKLGMKNVRSVISSGNIVFESSIRSTAKLEAIIEEAWPRERGFASTTIVRSQAEILAMIENNPFGDAKDTPDARLQVTFTQQPGNKAKLPYKDPVGYFEVLSYHDKAIFSTYDSTSQKAATLMTWLEKNYGKRITTRTWQTVHRIATRFDQ